ncbi:MAG: NAD(P)H-hydrate dehydratase [Lentisphaerae bacterium]|nr:NAD(P)H-hydrate dehydratase [Lentisphaerota bacterium]
MSVLQTVSAVRNAEKSAVDSGIAEYSLMVDAGSQAADIINFHYPEASRFVVLCGGGNNGGDALVAAGVLSRNYRRNVVIYSVKARDGFSGCAGHAVNDLPEDIGFFHRESLSVRDFKPGDVIIDGLLGIGFSGGALRSEVKSFIAAAVASGLPVAALDLPSGMNGDTGVVSPDGVIDADMTITFGMLKAGLFSGEGSRYRGKLRLVDIGLDAGASVANGIFTNLDAVKCVTHPGFDCHKNSRGRVLVWGGSSLYPGAPVLSAVAALRCGAGIVRIVSNGECRELAPAEVIVKKILCGSDVGRDVREFFPLSDVLVAGCGWGDETPVEALDVLWEFPGTLVLDADALNMFSAHIDKWRCRDRVIITPHPGEAARLAAALELPFSAGNREQSAKELAAKLQCTVLLKGRDSVVADRNGNVMRIASGNHALATAGSGDVLAGIIAACACSIEDTMTAAALAGFIHGVAGETAPGIPLAGEFGERAGVVLAAARQNALF